MKNPKDIQLINNIKQVENELQRLQSLERLESLQRLERLESLQSLQRLQSLESLERLESLQSLERLEQVEVNNKDYRVVELPNPNECIIYLDPPYRGTMSY